MPRLDGGSYSRTADTTALEELATQLADTADAYDYFATHQYAQVQNARAEIFCVYIEANAELEKITDIALRMLQNIATMDQEIATLKSQYEAAITAVNDEYSAPASGDQVVPTTLPGRDAAISRTRSQFTSQITTLEAKRQSFIDFINAKIVPYKTQDLEKIPSAAQDIARRLDQLDAYNMGHAYVGLRIVGAQDAVTKYRTAIANNEETAMANFMRALPTVLPEGVTGNPNDAIGGGWYQTEQDLINMARTNGPIPPPNDMIVIPQTSDDIVAEDYSDQWNALNNEKTALENELAQLQEEQANDPKQDAIDAYIEGSDGSGFDPDDQTRDIYIEGINDGIDQRREDRIYWIQERLRVINDDMQHMEV